MDQEKERLAGAGKKKKSRYFEVSNEVKDTTTKPSKQQTHTSSKNFHTGDKILFSSNAEEVKIVDLSGLDISSFKKKMYKKKKWKKQQQQQHKEFRAKDPFPGSAPVAKEKKQKYKRGHKVLSDTAQTKFHKGKFEQREKGISKAIKQAARAELLMQEQSGFLEADPGESTSEITQHEIASSVDIMSAQKFFELNLDKFGPYRMNYTRNGRFLLIAGRKGHVAAIDWQTKKLLCEMNVMETVNDVKWLHMETMYAVAQKEWTYVYDNQGIELHCLKGLDNVLRLEFLPYHFLLVSANTKGFLNYLDVSIGKKVAGFHTGLGRLDVMCQNPANAIIHLGHSGGTVTMWSPNVKEPLMKMLCHGSGTRAIAVDHQGRYMATSGIDRTLKIWDLRTYKPLQSYKTGAGASHLSFSQRELLAAGIGNTVEVYRDCCRSTCTAPYMMHRLKGSVHGLQFCPFEDVLGVGHARGFSSVLIPGAGEPNFDALEANPFQSKAQRKQAEVKMLLEKVQPDMISLDTKKLGEVDTKSLQEEMEEKKKLLYLKPQKVEFEPRYKKKGKSKTGKLEKRKKGVQFEKKREQIKEFLKHKQKEARTDLQERARTDKAYDVFERFKKPAE